VLINHRKNVVDLDINFYKFLYYIQNILRGTGNPFLTNSYYDLNYYSYLSTYTIDFSICYILDLLFYDLFR